MLNLVSLLEVTETIPTTDCMGIAVPNTIFNLVATIINLIKVVVPILLIIWGMLDFAKAIISKKEDDIKKHQKLFVSRIISAVLVFLIIFVVQLVFNLLGKVEKDSGNRTNSESLWDCSKNFINGVGDETTTAEDSNENTNTEETNETENKEA